MAKIFIPASSSSDSSYLLYKMLTETNDIVVSRIFHLDASDEDKIKYRIVCEWLRENVRDFNFGFAESEVDFYKEDNINNKEYNIALIANRHNADLICGGYNTYNWSHSNWYYNTNDPIHKFYEKNNPYCRQDHFALLENTSIPIDWPFMNKRNPPLGRWQIYEKLPDELKLLISVGCGNCNKCPKCKCRNWYFEQKELGKTAEVCDEEIMRLGDYGKYWKADSIPKNRHQSYINSQEE